MTKTQDSNIFDVDFLNYIQSFNKQPGEYSENELYLIGKRHVTLDKKNWKELCNILGVTKSKDAFRMWIKRKIEEDEFYTLQQNDNAQESEPNNEYVEQMKDLYKQKTNNRDILNAYRRLLREDARIDSLKESIKDAVQKLDKLPSMNISPFSVNSNNEAILLLSDLHIGVDCNNFYNTYNLKVAKERLQNLISSTISYCRNNNVKRLNVVNLGDLIHGIIHTNARIETQFDVIDQVIYASELLAITLKELQQAAPEIIYRSVSDNHSRVSANLSEHIEKENFNRLIDWYVKERVRNQSIIFAEDNIDYSLGLFTLQNGKQVAFAHGHLDDINTSFQHFVGATKTFIDYILLGHYHCEKVKSFQGSTVIVNGSIVGTEQYALSKRLFSEPSQKLLIFNKNDLISVSINLK